MSPGGGPAAGQSRGYDELAPGIRNDATGKGAVLCYWHMYEASNLLAKMCHPGDDSEFQSELDRSLVRIKEFITANRAAHPTRRQLDDEIATRWEKARSRGPELCKVSADNTSVDIYQAFKRRGIAAMRADVDDLLSVPREPVINPCM